MKWSHGKLQSILDADPVAVNNFTQSTQSEHGPRHRASEPVPGSLLRALHDKVDVIVAKHEAKRTVLPEPRRQGLPEPRRQFDKVMDTLITCGFFSYLTISDVAAVAFVSASKWANTPQCLRKVIALRRVVVKFVWSRAFDALIRQVSPQISEKLATVQAVYKYFELADKYPVPPFAATLREVPHDRQNELVCRLWEFILLLDFVFVRQSGVKIIFKNIS